jgi:D-glycero-alpha-D-manno-heptose-7-phosphate kinase
LQVTVIARAPLRIGLAGGGTDLPAYADTYGGIVLSTTIDRYVYIILTPAEPDVLQITAADSSSVLSRRENLFDAALFWGNDYMLPMEVVKHFEVSGGYRIFIAAEVPPGTGLGSSSTTAVALLRGLSDALDRPLSRDALAEVACEIEIDRMGMPIGRQDQYAAAFGGLNIIEFSAGRTVVTPFEIDESLVGELQRRVLLFFTGRKRRSTNILTAQRDETLRPGSTTLTALHEMKQLAFEMIHKIERGDLDAVGELLDRSWQRKRLLAPGVSNDEIDEWSREAQAAGAIGGKITGAGGGGFLLLYADPARRYDVIQRMSELGLVWVDMEFERRGAETIVGAPAFAFAGD